MMTKTPDPDLTLIAEYRDALQRIVDYDLVDTTGSHADLTEAEALDAVRRIASDALATGNVAMAHPPIASYVLGQAVTFHVDRGDRWVPRWIPGVVTRLESGLRPDGSAWHGISVSRSLGLPDGEWERAGAYSFGDGDDDVARVSPADSAIASASSVTESEPAPSGPPPSGPRRSRT